jgi:rod shape-determining protein MreC
MRNIIVFLYKYYNFILFLVLEFFALYLIYQYNTYQRASFINFSNGVSGQMFSTVANFKSYFRLRQINDSLHRENARLRSELFTSYYNNDIRDFKVNDTIYKQQYTYIEAKVLNNSINKRNNYITLNRGRSHGVKEQMGVICDNGVVGIVMAVSEHYCTVLSVLNSNAKLSAKIADNDAFGSLVWDGNDPTICRLLDVNKHVQVANGKKIVTSGYSTIFPENIPVGEVSAHSLEAGDNFHTIKVKMSTNFSNLTFVYVINNFFKEEMDSLETLTQSKLPDDQ